MPFACDRKGWPAFLASLDADFPHPHPASATPSSGTGAPKTAEEDKAPVSAEAAAVPASAVRMVVEDADASASAIGEASSGAKLLGESAEKQTVQQDPAAADARDESDSPAPPGSPREPGVGCHHGGGDEATPVADDGEQPPSKRARVGEAGANGAANSPSPPGENSTAGSSPVTGNEAVLSSNGVAPGESGSGSASANLNGEGTAAQVTGAAPCVSSAAASLPMVGVAVEGGGVGGVLMLCMP